MTKKQLQRTKKEIAREHDLSVVHHNTPQYKEDMKNYTGQGRDLTASESLASLALGVLIMLGTLAFFLSR